jgi:hypothetical protein
MVRRAEMPPGRRIPLPHLASTRRLDPDVRASVSPTPSYSNLSPPQHADKDPQHMTPTQPMKTTELCAPERRRYFFFRFDFAFFAVFFAFFAFFAIAALLAMFNMAVSDQCVRESHALHSDYYRVTKKTRLPLNEVCTTPICAPLGAIAADFHANARGDDDFPRTHRIKQNREREKTASHKGFLNCFLLSRASETLPVA